MHKNKFYSLLREKEILLLDGGFATTLELYGTVLDKSLWSAYTTVESPLSIVAAHIKFIEAGSDIVITSSYQMSFEGFRAKGFTTIQTEEYLRRATSCALVATNSVSSIRPVIAAASVGCYGAHLADGSEYSGNYGLSSQDLASWHRHKFDILARSGPDAMACETIPNVLECRALRDVISHQAHAMKESGGDDKHPSLAGWTSCSCRSGSLLNSGETFEDAVRAICDPPYEVECDELAHWGVGVNCTDPQYVCELLDVIKDSGVAANGRPIVVYPNKGETWDAVSREWEKDSGTGDEQFASMSLQWRDAGATVIGGCCRTTPLTISTIANVLDR